VRSPGSLNHDARYPAKVWATGQRQSYSPGDDGARQKGAFWPTPRFLVHGNGTVTDKLTGLMWFAAPSCLGERPWTDALSAVSDLNSRPGRYRCSGYKAAYTDWRTPNFKELQSLIHFARTGSLRPVDDPLAVGLDGEYWSSTTYAGKSDQAWTLRPSDGSLLAKSKEQEALSVWPVRGGLSELTDTSHVKVGCRDDVDPVPAGGVVAYTVQVANAGPDRARDVALETTLPSGTTLVSTTSDSGTCQENPSTVVCPLGDLERGESAQVILEIRVPDQSGVVTVTATATCASNDPNATDNEASETTTVTSGTGTGFRRGFVTDDDTVDISDPVSLLGHLFLGRPRSLQCEKAADVDDDGELNITDAIALLNYLFLGGREPASPFATCGLDPTPDRLGCGSSPVCPP
jgi:uncharacterized repeat protein (TIGR01451 family)